MSPPAHLPVDSHIRLKVSPPKPITAFVLPSFGLAAALASTAMIPSHASFTTLASRTMIATSTSLAATTLTVPLAVRMSIPTIGEVPSDDPIVYVSIVILAFMIVLAFFLVCWTQRRSAKEVKDSMKPNGLFRHLRDSSRSAVAEERPPRDAAGDLEADHVRIAHSIPRADSEYGSDTDSDDEEISVEEGDRLAAVETPKCVGFSDSTKAPSLKLSRSSPLRSSSNDGFETSYDQFLEAGDLGVDRKGLSMSARQLHEMHLGGH
jgi:hypothetical protein